MYSRLPANMIDRYTMVAVPKRISTVLFAPLKKRYDYRDLMGQYVRLGQR